MAQFIPTSRFARDPNAPRQVPERGDKDFNSLVSAAQILQFGTALGQTAGQIYDSADKGMLYHLTGGSQPFSEQEKQQGLYSIIGQQGQPSQEQPALSQAPPVQQQREVVTQQQRPSGLAQEFSQIVSQLPEYELAALYQMANAYRQPNADPNSIMQIGLSATRDPRKAEILNAAAQSIAAQQPKESPQSPVGQDVYTGNEPEQPAPNAVTQDNVGGFVPELRMPQMGESVFGVQSQPQASSEDIYDDSSYGNGGDIVSFVNNKVHELYGPAMGDEDYRAGSVGRQPLYAGDKEWRDAFVRARREADLYQLAQNANTLERQRMVLAAVDKIVKPDARWTGQGAVDDAARRVAKFFPQVGAEQQFGLETAEKMANIRRKGTQAYADVAGAANSMEKAQTAKEKRPWEISGMEQDQEIAAAEEERAAKNFPLEQANLRSSTGKNWADARYKDRMPVQGSGGSGGIVSQPKSDSDFVGQHTSDLENDALRARKQAEEYRNSLTSGIVKVVRADGKPDTVYLADLGQEYKGAVAEVKDAMKKQVEKLDRISNDYQKLILVERDVSRQLKSGKKWEEVVIPGATRTYANVNEFVTDFDDMKQKKFVEAEKAAADVNNAAQKLPPPSPTNAPRRSLR